MKKTLFASLLILFSFTLTVNCYADSANIGGYGNTVKILDNSEIKMESEKIDMYVDSESTEVDVTYNFVNTTNEETQVVMGFPEKTDGYPEENYKLHNFQAYEEDEKIEVSFRNEEEAVTEGVNWYIFKVNFKPHEEKEIKNTYWIKHTFWGGKFRTKYILETGASWKGNIGKIDIYAHFNEDVSIYDVNRRNPEKALINEEKSRIEWHFNDIEPTSEDNIEISMRYYYQLDRSSCICEEKCLDYDHLELSKEEVFGLSSSYLNEGEVNYYACKAFDGREETAWVESSEDEGVGEWINVPLENISNIAKYPDTCLDDMCVRKIKINKLRIFNGFGKNRELWEKNNRVKEIKITFNDSKEIILEIPDVYGYQTIDLPEEITTNRTLARVEILDVYRGSEYNDTAISEIRFLSFIDNGYNLSPNSLKDSGQVESDDLYQKLKGKIVLKVESKGEAYYINPKNEKYYFLGRPSDAFEVMREQGVGISEKDFNSFDGYAPDNLAGTILLRVEANGEAYYVDPDSKEMHYLGRPGDAFEIMRNLGRGISNNDFDKF